MTKQKCYVKRINPEVKCKGKVKRCFSGGDEGVMCYKHYKEVSEIASEMGH